MLTEDATDEPEVCADVMVTEAIIDGPGVYTGMVINKTFVKPQVHAAEGGSMEPKPWIVDSGCSTHFCPNWSKFIKYMPYASPCQICLGHSSRTPSMCDVTI